MKLNRIDPAYSQNYSTAAGTGVNANGASFGEELKKGLSEAAELESETKKPLMYVSVNGGEKILMDQSALFALCHAPTGESVNVYREEGYTEENPLYLVKGTGKDGNIYELTVDVSKVNPNNCSYAELAALSVHTGQRDFITLSMIGTDANYDSVHDKLDYMAAACGSREEMARRQDWASYMKYDQWIKAILNYIDSLAISL